jgi:hypothetical protein
MTPERFTDPLGLVGDRRSPKVMVGSADVTNALRGGDLHMAMDSRGEVRLNLDPAALPPEPVDYLATMTYTSRGAGVGGRFAGHIHRAVPDGARIHVEAFGASLLAEHKIGLLISRGVAPPELFYTMARSAGMSDDELEVQDLDAASPEVFEVIAPVHGIAIERRHRFAGLTLVPGHEVQPRLEEMDFGGELDAMAAGAFVISLQSTRRVYEAEQAGLREIDTGINWLVARLQHGLALFPDGTIQPFERANARARPYRGDLVVVRSLGSGRRWLRSVAREAMAFTAKIDRHDPLLDLNATNLQTTDRLALAACRRATSEVEPLARVQALSEAIECLVAGVSVPRRWPREDLSRIKQALPADLPAELVRAAKQAIGDLNRPGLMQRFRMLVEEQGVPVSNPELDLLDQTRAVRNDAVHGRAATPPSPAELDYATAIVCRVIVEHLRGAA